MRKVRLVAIGLGILLIVLVLRNLATTGRTTLQFFHSTVSLWLEEQKENIPERHAAPLEGCPVNLTRPFASEWYSGSSSNSNSQHISTTAKRTEQQRQQTKTQASPPPPPPSPPPQVYHLSGKFGKENKFRLDVLSHQQYIQSTGVIDQDKIWEYYKYPRFILRDKTWKQHLHFYRLPKNKGHLSQRGGGWWFWKPALIHRHLVQTLNDGDFLVYTDNDVIEHLAILPFLLPDMVRNGHNLAMHEMNTSRTERQYTKRDVYEAYCPNRALQGDTSPQFDAMFIILRRDAATLQLAYQYLQAVKNYHAVSDDESWLPNYSEFYRRHRRDQSMINLILKCRYQEPEKKSYDHSCQWKPIRTYRIPVWDQDRLTKTIQATEEGLRQQEQLFRQARTNETILKNPHDPYWRSYRNRTR